MGKTVKKLASLLLICLLSAGCQSGTQTKPAESPAESSNNPGVVTVYTSVPQELIDQFKAEFEKKSHAEVKVYRAVTNDILAKLKAEKEAGGVAADVVWVADTASAQLLKEQNYLQKYDSPEAAALAPSMKDPQGYYYGSRVINMVLAYHTKVEKPESWNDLLKPQYKGKIGIPAVSSGTSYTFVGALASQPDFGWKFFEQMKANGGMQVKANKDATQKLASGEFQLAVILDYMIKDLKDKGSPVDYVIPKEGAIMVVSPIALLDGAKNPAGGKQFIDFTLAREGQELLMKQNVVTVRTDLTPVPGVPMVADIKAFPIPDQYLNEAREEINSKFEAIFGKP